MNTATRATVSRPIAVFVVLFFLTIGRVGEVGGQSLPASSNNALTELGQQLFQDPHLSADGTIRCASCHIPDRAYADDRQIARGVEGRLGTRNAPSLAIIGRSDATSFFWDGRRTTLEQAVLDPFINPVEMGLRDNASLLSKLAADASYRTAFAKGFPRAASPVTLTHVAAALSAYVRSLDRRTSAYDLYRSQHDPAALNAQAQQGLILFSGKGKCAECHRLEGSPVTLTDHAYHRTGVGLSSVEQNLPKLTQDVIERSLQGADIGNRVATHADESQLGRFNVTRNPADIGLFRTPSLRGVALTAPYMHDGSVPTLDEAIDRETYYRSLQAGRPLNLTVQEKRELRAFLEAL